MIVDPRTAAAFIETYKAFLLDIYLPEGEESETVRVLDKMELARERFVAEPTLLDAYIAKVKRPVGLWRTERPGGTERPAVHEVGLLKRHTRLFCFSQGRWKLWLRRPWAHGTPV